MSKETRNLIIVGVIALLVGYIAGGAMQTGRCPLTGKIICKDRAAACDKMKACAEACETSKNVEVPGVESAKADGAN